MHVDKELEAGLKEIGIKITNYTTMDVIVDVLRDAHGLHCTTNISIYGWSSEVWDINNVYESLSHVNGYSTHRAALTAAAKKATEIVKERIDNGKK